MKKIVLLLFVLLISLRINYSQQTIAVGGTYYQNFDSLGTSGNATLPSKWVVDKNTTVVRTPGTYSGAVTATDQYGGNNMTTIATNGIYNFGAGDKTTATDRAIGWLSSSTATKSGNLYLWLRNSGAATITSLTISYNVEKYRNGSNGAGFSIQMFYSTDGTTWISAGASFLTIIPADTNNSGYPSAPGSTYAISGQALSGLSIAQDSSLYLAWNYSVTAGTTTSNAQALGIDDFFIDNALPVELTSFTSTVNENKVTLKWTTATEVNNYGFEIQRLLVNSQRSAWENIGFVQGNGNSNSPKNYTFIDEPSGGKEFRYRLKQIDFNGAFEYSEIVDAILENVSEFKLDQNFPNPFNPSTKISYTIPIKTNVKLHVYNLLAQMVAELANGIQEAGRYEVTFDGNNLPSGVYFYKLEAGNYAEVKKLLLVK